MHSTTQRVPFSLLALTVSGCPAEKSGSNDANTLRLF